MPNRLALRTSGADFTYAELEQQARETAERLRDEGATEGALIPLDMPPPATS